MQIQTKTALLFTALTAFIILCLSLVVYYFASRFAFNDFVKRLELRAVIASKIRFEQDHTSASAFNELRRQYLEVLPQEKEYILSYDTVSHKVTGPQQPDLPPSFYRRIEQQGGKTVFLQQKQLHYAGILYRDESGVFLVIKSAVNAHDVKALHHLKQVLVFTFIASIIVVFTVGMFFSKKAFEPVRNINDRVRDISAHNLHLRLESPRGRDEISELANTFNNMLDRLETAFETQNNFVSNASHELRTPLTAIIGEADIALGKARTNDEYKRALEIIIKEANKLQHLTNSLLGLAQSGFDGKKQAWETLRIDELIFEVKHSIDEIEPSNNLHIDLEELPLEEYLLIIEGNPHLLKLAVSNVVLNACKYSNNNEVTLSLTHSADTISITVTDKGIGIPAPELKHIYDPFFRASNTNSFEGYGIGLPLTLSIMRLHHGSILVQSEEGKGTRVKLTLPCKIPAILT